jgi:hypothetical protein
MLRHLTLSGQISVPSEKLHNVQVPGERAALLQEHEFDCQQKGGGHTELDQ